eukprot:COSAG04_NODE_901_length_9547_cov_3.066469_11_plen_102_part_00
MTEGGPGGLRRSFRVFDRNGDGQISVNEFDRVCRKYLNLRYDKALVKQVMEHFDDTGDGVIDFRKARRPKLPTHPAPFVAPNPSTPAVFLCGCLNPRIPCC